MIISLVALICILLLNNDVQKIFDICIPLLVNWFFMPFVHILNGLVYFVICFVFVAEVLELLCVKDISPLLDICFQIFPASFKFPNIPCQFQVCIFILFTEFSSGKNFFFYFDDIIFTKFCFFSMFLVVF